MKLNKITAFILSVGILSSTVSFLPVSAGKTSDINNDGVFDISDIKDPVSYTHLMTKAIIRYRKLLLTSSVQNILSQTASITIKTLSTVFPIENETIILTGFPISSESL